jgi:hypothetical protein
MKRHHADFRRRQGGLYQAPHISEGLISLHCLMNFMPVRAREVVRHYFAGCNRFGLTFLQ